MAVLFFWVWLLFYGYLVDVNVFILFLAEVEGVTNNEMLRPACLNSQTHTQKSVITSNIMEAEQARMLQEHLKRVMTDATQLNIAVSFVFSLLNRSSECMLNPMFCYSKSSRTPETGSSSIIPLSNNTKSSAKHSFLSVPTHLRSRDDYI